MNTHWQTENSKGTIEIAAYVPFNWGKEKDSVTLIGHIRADEITAVTQFESQTKECWWCMSALMLNVVQCLGCCTMFPAVKRMWSGKVVIERMGRGGKFATFHVTDNANNRQSSPTTEHDIICPFTDFDKFWPVDDKQCTHTTGLHTWQHLQLFHENIFVWMVCLATCEGVQTVQLGKHCQKLWLRWPGGSNFQLEMPAVWTSTCLNSLWIWMEKKRRVQTERVRQRDTHLLATTTFQRAYNEVSVTLD